jgi:hypothetical protein
LTQQDVSDTIISIKGIGGAITPSPELQRTTED